MIKLIVACFVLSLLSCEAYALSPKIPYELETFTTTTGTETTQWYDARNITYINFTVVATAGSGVITVQYSSERDQPAASIFSDANTGAYTTSAPTNLYASGLSAHWVRASITCASTCTYTVRFTGKGLK